MFFYLYNFQSWTWIRFSNLQSVILCPSEFTGVMNVYLNKPRPQMKMTNIDKIFNSFPMVAKRFIKHNQIELEVIVLSKQSNLQL